MIYYLLNGLTIRLAEIGISSNLREKGTDTDDAGTHPAIDPTDLKDVDNDSVVEVGTDNGTSILVDGVRGIF